MLIHKMKKYQRKQNRKKTLQYERIGLFFITILIKGRKPLFGDVLNREMKLSKYGEIALNEFKILESHEVRFLKTIIMPDHLHVIVELVNTKQGLITIPKLIGKYKMLVSKKIHQVGNTSFKWHRSYHDWIIRTPRELENAKNYIENNPKNYHKKSRRVVNEQKK